MYIIFITEKCELCEKSKLCLFRSDIRSRWINAVWSWQVGIHTADATNIQIITDYHKYVTSSQWKENNREAHGDFTVSRSGCSALLRGILNDRVCVCVQISRLCAEEAAAQEQTGQVEECLKVNLLKIKQEGCKKVKKTTAAFTDRRGRK